MSKRISTCHNCFHIQAQRRINGHLKLLSVQSDRHLLVLIIFLEILCNGDDGFLFGHSLDGNAVYFQLCPDHIVCKKMAPQTVCAHKKHEEDQNLGQGVFHLFVHMIVLPLAYFFRAAG